MKRSYLSDLSNRIPESGLKDFFDVANTMEGAISLGVGEPDFETPSHVKDAAISAILEGKTKYTANIGMMELRKAISTYLKERFFMSYEPSNQILITVGASEGIDLALKVLANPLDEVLLVEPSYVSYKPCIELCHAKCVVLNTKEENNFKLTKEELESKITSKTRVLILPFPSNPSGAIMEKEDLEAIREVVIKHDLFVISDEIYAELTYGGSHVSISVLPDMYERTLVLNGFSKAFAMTGWRLGYAAGPVDIIDAMNRIHQYNIMVAPTPSQFAGIEAMTSPLRDQEVDHMRTAYDERRRILVDGFREMGLSCFEPKGAFYVFPSIKETKMTSMEFCKSLLAEEKVAVIPGNAFGECGEGYIRCSYAYSIDSINECLKRMNRFVKKHVK